MVGFLGQGITDQINQETKAKDSKTHIGKSAFIPDKKSPASK
jgi:hypothetical protein